MARSVHKDMVMVISTEMEITFPAMAIVVSRGSEEGERLV